MSPEKNGGPAFPRPASIDTTNGTLPDGDDVIDEQDGMSLRDWFAGQALAGFMNHQGWIGYEPESAGDDGRHRAFLIKHYAKDAYAVADAMLEARKQ